MPATDTTPFHVKKEVLPHLHGKLTGGQGDCETDDLLVLLQVVHLDVLSGDGEGEAPTIELTTTVPN